MYVYKGSLIRGKLIRRYKRFLVDVELDDGRIVTAHCTNTGSLKSCLVPGAPVYLSKSDNPARKTRYTWESIYLDGHWVGVNTSVPNKLVYEAIKQKLLAPFMAFDRVRAEVKFGGSRFDLLLENEEERMWVEIKNVTYREGPYALFPDAPTARGRKHLEELIRAVEGGDRAAMVFVVARPEASFFAPAREIDPAYADMLKEAVSRGVEIYPFRTRYTAQGASLADLLPVEL
ncbi:MAG: DNA/RNA nuclease SfsA [Chlorobi bacterium]|nr:DNA/RNA nuclease SfsA [Chlorobiota bacterium]